MSFVFASPTVRGAATRSSRSLAASNSASSRRLPLSRRARRWRPSDAARRERKTSVAPAPVQRRAPGRHVVRLRRHQRGEAEYTGVLSSGVFRGYKVSATPSDSAWPRSTEAIRPWPIAHLDARIEQCRACSLEHGCVDVPQRKAVAKREHFCSCIGSATRRNCHDAGSVLATTSVRSVPSSASTCAANMPHCTKCVALSPRSLDRAPSARCAAARRQPLARASRRRVRCQQRHGRASAAAPCCQCRAARSLRCARTTTRRASRACAPASPPGQARACALVLPIVGACTESSSHSAVRVNAVRDEAQRRSCSDLDADDVEPITEAESTQWQQQRLARRARRAAAPCGWCTPSGAHRQRVQPNELITGCTLSFIPLNAERP